MKKALFFMLSLLAFAACEAELDSIYRNQSMATKEVSKSNNIISADDAAKMALEFRKSLLAENGMTRSAANDKGVASVYAWRSRDVSPKAFTRSSVADMLPDTLLYIVNFEQNSGYALVSATKELPGVVAYIEEGALTPDDDIDNPGFQEFLENYEERYPIMVDSIGRGIYDSIRIADRYHIFDSMPHIPLDTGGILIYTYAVVEHVTPIMITSWGQGWPFNRACPLDENGDRTLAGCVAIATAQIVALHRSPDSYNGHEYLWDDIVRQGDFLPYETLAINSVANLVHDIGELVNTSYGTNISTAYSDNVANALDSLGYHYEKLNTVTFDSIKSDIENGYPVYISGRRSGDYYGHAWVADGFVILQVNIAPINGEMFYRKYVHCNWGWYGAGNGYYMMGAFENQYNPNTHEMTTGPLSFNNDILVYRGIYPL